MHIDKIIPTVGADLSRPPPIYRPVWAQLFYQHPLSSTWSPLPCYESASVFGRGDHLPDKSALYRSPNKHHPNETALDTP